MYNASWLPILTHLRNLIEYSPGCKVYQSHWPPFTQMKKSCQRYRDTCGENGSWWWRKRLTCWSCKPGSQRLAGKPPEARKMQGQIFSSRFQREHSPAITLIMDFQPPELWAKIHVVLSHPCVLWCYGNLRKLRRYITGKAVISELWLILCSHLLDAPLEGLPWIYHFS